MKPETATENSPEPRPAATLVLLRRTARCPLQALMVVRHTAVEFAGGAAVFPGGRVDASDHVGTEADDDAFRFAAIRETFEECGIVLAYDDTGGEMVSKARARALRQTYRLAVSTGELPFADMLRDERLRPATDLLIPFAHWITPPLRKKRYDTHFFIAPYDGDQEILHDDGEVTQAEWISPETLLSDAKNGRYKLVFATRLNVERLAAFASVDDAIATVRDTPVVTVRPESVETPKGRMVRIPGDAGYGGELFLSNDPSSI